MSLTSTSRVRITVSVRPTSGTVATSLPHSASVFRASALTFRFTLPVSKHTHGVTVERLYRLPLPSPAVLSCSVYRGKTASHLLLKPTHYPRCVFLPPRFPSHSPSLIPICCLIIAHGLSPTPTFLPSQPTILHTEDKYRSPLEGEVSDCFVRDTT